MPRASLVARARARTRHPRVSRLLAQKVVGHVDGRREGVHGVVDVVLDRALLLREGRLEVAEVLAARGRHLGLHARLEALLGLRHELRAHVVPAREVGGRDGHARVREVPDLTGRAMERG